MIHCISKKYLLVGIVIAISAFYSHVQAKATTGWQDVDENYLLDLLNKNGDPIGVEITELEGNLAQLQKLEKSRVARGDDVYTAEQRELATKIIKSKNDLKNKVADLRDGSLTIMGTNLPQERAVELVTKKIVWLARRVETNGLIQKIAGKDDTVSVTAKKRITVIKKQSKPIKEEVSVTVTVGDETISKEVSPEKADDLQRHIMNAIEAWEAKN